MRPLSLASASSIDLCLTLPLLVQNYMNIRSKLPATELPSTSADSATKLPPHRRPPSGERPGLRHCKMDSSCHPIAHGATSLMPRCRQHRGVRAATTTAVMAECCSCRATPLGETSPCRWARLRTSMPRGPLVGQPVGRMRPVG
jgi:hypothetical protein